VDSPFQKTASSLMAASLASGHARAWIRSVFRHLFSSDKVRAAISLVGDWAKFINRKTET